MLLVLSKIYVFYTWLWNWDFFVWDKVYVLVQFLDFLLDWVRFRERLLFNWLLRKQTSWFTLWIFIWTLSHWIGLWILSSGSLSCLLLLLLRCYLRFTILKYDFLDWNLYDLFNWENFCFINRFFNHFFYFHYLDRFDRNLNYLFNFFNNLNRPINILNNFPNLLYRLFNDPLHDPFHLNNPLVKHRLLHNPFHNDLFYDRHLLFYYLHNGPFNYFIYINNFDSFDRDLYTFWHFYDLLWFYYFFQLDYLYYLLSDRHLFDPINHLNFLSNLLLYSFSERLLD